jgi:hypothetical protein
MNIIFWLSIGGTLLPFLSIGGAYIQVSIVSIGGMTEIFDALTQALLWIGF